MIQARNLVPEIGDYSGSEQDTGFTWVDGKHIYRKTLFIGALPNNGTGTINHGISDFGSIIETKLRWYDTEDKRWFTDSRWDSSSVYVGQLQINSTKVYYKGQGTNWSTRTNSAYVTLYYTKSS